MKGVNLGCEPRVGVDLEEVALVVNDGRALCSIAIVLHQPVLPQEAPRVNYRCRVVVTMGEMIWLRRFHTVKSNELMHWTWTILMTA